MQDVKVVVEIVVLDGFTARLAEVHRRVPLLLQIVRPTVPYVSCEIVWPIIRAKSYVGETGKPMKAVELALAQRDCW